MILPLPSKYDYTVKGSEKNDLHSIDRYIAPLVDAYIVNDEASV